MWVQTFQLFSSAVLIAFILQPLGGAPRAEQLPTLNEFFFHIILEFRVQFIEHYD